MRQGAQGSNMMEFRYQMQEYRDLQVDQQQNQRNWDCMSRKQHVEPKTAQKMTKLGLHVQKTTCGAKRHKKKTKLYRDTNWTYTKHWTVNIDPRRTMGRHELGAKHGMLRGDVKSHKNKTTQVHKNLCQTRRGRRRTSWRTRATRGEDHEDGEYVERGLHQRAALQKELTKQRPQTKKSSFLNSSVDILSYPPIHNTSPTSFVPPHPPSPVIQCLNI